MIYTETIHAPESPIDGNAWGVVPGLKNIKFTFLISGSHLLLDRLIFSLKECAFFLFCVFFSFSEVIGGGDQVQTIEFYIQYTPML